MKTAIVLWLTVTLIAVCAAIASVEVSAVKAMIHRNSFAYQTGQVN